MEPTETLYKELKTAYDFFNNSLFGGELPPCLITLQRIANVFGYFSAEKFSNRTDSSLRVDELAVNPAYFSIYPLDELCQTLAHEMAHAWQHHFGAPGRRGYHNKEWAYKMESIGLMPSSTGKAGGSKTGEKMADYIIEGGLFHVKLGELLSSGFTVSWSDARPPLGKVKQLVKENGLGAVKDKLEEWGFQVEGCPSEGQEDEQPELIVTAFTAKPTRAKFTCPSCLANAWGKPSLKIVCYECNVLFEGGDGV